MGNYVVEVLNGSHWTHFYFHIQFFLLCH